MFEVRGEKQIGRESIILVSRPIVFGQSTQRAKSVYLSGEKSCLRSGK